MPDTININHYPFVLFSQTRIDLNEDGGKGELLKIQVEFGDDVSEAERAHWMVWLNGKYPGVLITEATDD